MATHLKPVLLTCLLLLMVLMVEDKPALAKGGKGLRERKNVLEKAVRELDEEMNKRETLERSRDGTGSPPTPPRPSDIPECQNYTILDDADRKETHTTLEADARCDDSMSSGWYRFDGAAGTQMSTTCVPEYRCGTYAPGWLSDGHPTQADGQVTRQVCFTWRSECCYADFDIKVRNCGSYFVYYLSSSPGCTRFCGTC